MTLDMLLTTVGVVLIGFGLYIFLTSKGRADGGPGNRVEGFGIKVDVSNPSILLIVLGVGLVLVPRFFPVELPNDVVATTAEQGDEPVQSVPPPLVQMPPIERTPASHTPPPILPREEPARVQTAEKAAAAKPLPAPASTSRPAPAPAASPQPAKPAPVVNTAAAETKPKPEPKAKPIPKVATPVKREAPEVQEKRVVVAKAQPLPPPKPKPEPKPEPIRPDLWVVVDAEVSDRAGIHGMTAGEYSQALRERLAEEASQRFGKDRVTIEGNQPQVRGSDYAQVCADSPADKVLLATVRIPPWGISTIPSAYWPDLVMAGVDCSNGQVQPSEPRRLTPGYNDSVFFEKDFVKAAKSFIISHAYFFEVD